MTDLDLTKTVRLRNGWPLISLQKIDNTHLPIVGIYQRPDKTHEVGRWKLDGTFYSSNIPAFTVGTMDLVQVFDDRLDEIKATYASGAPRPDMAGLFKEDLPWLIAQVETLRGEKAAGQASIASLQAQLDALKEGSCPICGAPAGTTCDGDTHLQHIEADRMDTHIDGGVNHEDAPTTGASKADDIVEVRVIPWGPGELGVWFTYRSGNGSAQAASYLPNCRTKEHLAVEVERDRLREALELKFVHHDVGSGQSWCQLCGARALTSSDIQHRCALAKEPANVSAS